MGIKISGASTPTILGPGSLATPSLIIEDSAGNLDNGLYSGTTDQINVAIGGAIAFKFTSTGFVGAVSTRPVLRNVAATATVPNITPKESDLDTGAGSAGVNMLSLIAGGEEGIRLVQDTWGCSLHIPEITTPTAIASFGAVYTKADNALYFQDGAGVEHTVTIS